MSNVFRVGPGQGYGVRYFLDVGDATFIPGVHCSLCGQTWATGGVAYPTADVAVLPKAVRDRLGGPPVDCETLAKIVKGVRQIIPEPRYLPTGTSLGPSSGKARGTIPLVPHMNPWTFFMTAGAIEEFRVRGIRGLVGAPMALKGKHKTSSPIMEIEVDARSRLAPEWFAGKPPVPCAKCGRQEFKIDHPLVLDSSTVPRDLDIFRGVDVTRAIFVTESFRIAAESLGVDSIAFEPVRLV